MHHPGRKAHDKSIVSRHEKFLQLETFDISSLRRVLMIAALIAAMTLLLHAPAAHAQANVQGTWQALPTSMPINPVHTALMANGKILVVSGSGNDPAQMSFSAGVFDPIADTVTTQPITWDMFCNGMIVLPDGRPFIAGGNLQYDPFHGWQRTSAYDPATRKFVDMEDMAHGRWYPTTTLLGDGRVMTFSGLDEIGNTNTQVEIYTVGAGWGAPVAAPWTPPLYPRLHLLPNGKVFYSGSTTQSRTFDPATNLWSGVIATTNYGGGRTYGSSVLLPLTPANNYAPKVIIFGGGNPSTATTEIIDLSATTPAWVYGPPMSKPRIEMNATLLPNGKVLTVGGSLNDEDTATASLNADLYDSVTNTMGSAGANAVPRLYHSVSLLLPDGTVWVAGGNPQRGTYEPSMEIYSPPYLFNANGTPATRPTITSVTPGVIGYGTSFQVSTPDAANIASVVLMKNGSVTHAFDMDQRLVGLTFAAGSGMLNLIGPPNGNIAPPGYYMLFLIDAAGVPSVAKFVQISKAPSDVPPTATITLPAADQSIAPGGSVTFAGTGTPFGSATITGYSWSIRGGSPATSQTQNPGAVTFSTIGTYTAVLTVTDSNGITSPSPATRTIVVHPVLAAPTLTVVNPNAGAQGSINLTVVLTGTNFVTGATCSFGAGISVNSCIFNSATQITANIDVLASAAVGSRDVTVTNPDSQIAALTAGFTVGAGTAAAAPTLTAVSPNAEFRNTPNATVILTGTNFQPSPICDFDVDFGGTINTCTYVSATQISVNLTIGANAVLGGHNVVVTNADGQSAKLINGFTVTENLGNTVKLGNGFTPGALVLVGNALLNGSVLELTDGNLNEDSSAWYATPVNVQDFTTDFTFQITPGITADGFTFTLQGNSTAAIGQGGGELGYGPATIGGTPLIPKSVAVKFDLYDSGTSISMTGLYLNGVTTTTPGPDMTVSGIDLHSGDILAAHMTYDGTTLAVTVTDTTTHAVFSTSFPVDIPTTVGATTAYAGFTGGTGGLSAVQNILIWTLGPLAPAVGITPASPLNFPDTTVNITSAPLTITVTNSGTATLHVTGATLTGTNPGDFAATTAAGCSAIAPSATCTISVTFTPSGTGARQADLQIADDATGSPQTVALNGNGTALPTPAVTITPAGTISFPNTAPGVTSAPVTVTITNSGNATLNITAVAFGGANASEFAAASNTCTGAALAANATCTVGVTFSPASTGVRQTTLQITDNATSSPQSAALSGTGTVATAPTVTITPAIVSVSATQGTTSSPTTITVTNSGTTALHISNVAFAGANVSEFVNSGSPCVGTSIATGSSCAISVSFAPLGIGSRVETVTITDDASGSPQSVSVTGTAAAAFTMSSPSTALSASVAAGQTATYNLQLTPGAGYSGNVMMACSGVPAAAACTVTANPIPVTAGSVATFTVKVTTTARSLMVPYTNHRPVSLPPYLMLITVALCMTAIAMLYQLKLRNQASQRHLAYSAYSGLLILVLAAYGLAGCASSGPSSPVVHAGTPQGTYTIVLTPTASSTTGQALQQLTPTQLTLTVN